MVKNFAVILASRPGADSEPSEDNFEVKECPMPLVANEGDILIENLWIEIHPALRCRMNEYTGVEYILPWEIGSCIAGLGGIGKVMKSENKDFPVGDYVTMEFEWPWKSFFVKTPDKLINVTPLASSLPKLTDISSIFGVNGLTVIIGLWEKAGLKMPNNNNKDLTMVVSAAAGNCGLLVGQMAKLMGVSHVVGIAGSDEKCAKILGEPFQYDEAVNYKHGAEELEASLRNSCPRGVDIYFDNVGGFVSDVVITKLMNVNGRVVLCGQIANYNKDLPYPPPIPKATTDAIEVKKIDRERFLVLRYRHLFDEAQKQMLKWVSGGKLKMEETVYEGIGQCGKAMVELMKGVNFGKQLVSLKTSSSD